MTPGRALIVGGGIGGLSTAIAMQGNEWNVRVVEIRPDLHSSVNGVGIIQPVNALRALDMIGCAADCMRFGYSTAAWGRILDVDGNQVGEMPGALIPGSGLPPMNGITRPKLHEILTNKALATGATIDYDLTFESLDDKRDGVDVVFTDGTTDHFDVVVGADGVWSKVRPLVLESHEQPVYNGQSAFRCNIPRKPEIDRITLQKGPEGMAGFVPIGPDLAYLFYNTGWNLADRVAPENLHQLLRDCLSPFGGLTGRIRDEYINEDADIVFHPEYWLIASPPWHKGRIVLIGDAVHAVTPHMGQGAAQAIEDGIVLAECLADYDNPEDAFKSYTERRYDRCKLVVEGSAQIGEWELNPTEDMDQPGLTQRVLERMVQPI